MFVLRAEKDGNHTGEAQENGRKKFSSVCLFVCLFTAIFFVAVKTSHNTRKMESLFHSIPGRLPGSKCLEYILLISEF